jgi:uncharacterized protein YjbI with pentapeptide repeats
LKSIDPHRSLLDQVTERIRDLGLPIHDSDDLTACLSNHRLCIFLDGLDELPLGPGAAVDDYVAFLDELTAVPNLKVVISARTGLFSDEVARFTERFSILEMQEWDPNNWVAFLDQACTCGVLSHGQRASLASAIERSSSLKDLATRPLYCRMMAETCDTILRHATLQESELLELYVNNFIDRKQRPGGLKRTDLLKRMRHTAFCMHAQNKFHFSVADLAEILRRLLPAIANEKTWAEHLTTMRVHSFLDNSIDGTFAFAHAAFRSYFLADLLFAEVFSKTSEAEWSAHSWKSLGEVYVDQDIATLIVQMIESHHNVFPAEWIRSYMQFSSSDRQDFQLWRGGAPAVVFRNLVLLWTEMQRASRGGVTDASGLDLSDLNFKAPSLKNINFDRADLTRCNMAGTRVTNCTFRNARLSFANLSHARLDTCDFSGSQLHNVILSGCHFLGAANRFYGSAGFDFASLNSAQKGQIVPSLLGERREFERVGDSEAVKWLVDRLAAVGGFP